MRLTKALLRGDPLEHLVSRKMDGSVNTFKIDAIGRRPLSERVYETLKAAIVNGHLPSEAKLTETAIAQRMGVSPTPVREAFRRLAAEGFVMIAPWRGVRVQSFSDAEMAEMYQCREVLEGLAGRLAAATIDTAGVEMLRQLIEGSRKARTTSAVVEANSAFHSKISTYAGNSKLQALLGLFHDMILRDRTLTAYNATRRREILAEHAGIVDALEAQDVDRAEQMSRLHVQKGFAYRLQKKPQGQGLGRVRSGHGSSRG